MINNFQKIEKLINDDVYCSNIGASNILFIGGCRSFMYSTLFSELCKHNLYFTHAQFGIGTIGVHMIDLLKREKTKNIRSVVENADYIVCEQIRNYKFLNTSTKCEENLFNNFNIKKNCKVIQIPNLDFRYYKNDLIFDNPQDNNNIEIINVIKKNNLNRFINHCKKYEFHKFAEYTETFINKERMFSRFNHPYPATALELFKELIEKLFEQKIEGNVLNALKCVRFFDHVGTNLEKVDYQLGMSVNVK